MTRPFALDLFCGAGGASMGLSRAGFDLVGIDLLPQPRYPFRFVRADVLALPFDLSMFDLIWASPPCQAYVSTLGREARRRHPDLIDATRRLLSDHPMTVIENIPRSPVRPDLRLNGLMFPQLRVIRTRHFELSFFMLAPPLRSARGLRNRGNYVTVVGHGTPSWDWHRGYRWRAEDCRKAMGIDWMIRAEIVNAVPPVYAEYIGRAVLKNMLVS